MNRTKSKKSSSSARINSLGKTNDHCEFESASRIKSPRRYLEEGS